MDKERALGELNNLVAESDWGLLPVVRENWGRNYLDPNDLRMVGRLARVVALTRCVLGERLDEERLMSLKSFVYIKGWNPLGLQDLAVRALIEFGSEETVVEPLEANFEVGEWKVRRWEVAEPMCVRSETSKNIVAYLKEFGYPRTMQVINSVDDVLVRMVGFKLIGILEPEKGWDEFVPTLEVERNRIFNKLTDLALFLSTNGLMTDGVPLIDEKWQRRSVERIEGDWTKWQWQRLTEKTCKSRSSIIDWTWGMSREEIINWVKKRGLWEKLFEQERRVLMAGGYFKGKPLSDTELAQKLQLKYITLIATMNRIVGVANGEIERMVGTDGLPSVRETDFPYSLILLSLECKPEWLVDNLDPLQMEIWKYVVTPGEFGHYHTRKEIEEKFGARCELYSYRKRLAEKIRGIIEMNGGKVVRQKNFRVK